MGNCCKKSTDENAKAKLPTVEDTEKKLDQVAVVIADDSPWDDNHSPEYTINWNGYTVDTKYHEYTPDFGGQPASNYLQYKTPPTTTKPNFWLPSNVQVINNELHLAIYKSPQWSPTWQGKPVWCCAEAVISDQPLTKYGTISVDVKCYGNSVNTPSPSTSNWSSFVKNMNVVLGIFTYDKTRSGTSSNPCREIDLIETISQDNGQPQKGDAQFTMQLAGDDITENIHRIDVDYSSLNIMNVSIDWQEAQVTYTLTNKDSNNTSDVIASWVYTDATYIPEPSASTFLHFNLWVYNNGTADNKPRHIAISNVSFPS